MFKRGGFFLAGLILFVLFCSVVCADLAIDVKEKYSEGSELKGKLFFEHENVISPNEKVAFYVDNQIVREISYAEFLNSFGEADKISLQEEKIERTGASAGVIPLVFYNEGSKTEFGIYLSAAGVRDFFDVAEINSFNISFKGEAVENVYPHLPRVDVGNDNIIDYSFKGNLKNNFIEINSSYVPQYNTNKPSVEIKGDKKLFCERVKLKPGSEFRISAYVKKVKENGGLNATVLDNEFDEVKNSCKLNPTNAFSKVSCDFRKDVNEEKEHFVCLFAYGGESTFYEIQYDNSLEPKGYVDGELINSNFYIYAELRDYEKELKSKASFYIDAEKFLDNYAKRGNIIPITVYSGKGKIIFSDLLLKVKSQGGLVSTITEFTPISYSAEGLIYEGEINQTFSLEETPVVGEHTLFIKIGDLKSNVANFEVVYPLNASIVLAPAFPSINENILFSIESRENLKSAKWIFEGGVVLNGLSVEHSFLTEGEHNISVEVVDENDVTSVVSKEITVGGIEKSLVKILNETMKTVEEKFINFPETQAYEKFEIIGRGNIYGSILGNLTLIKIRVDSIDLLPEENRKSEAEFLISNLAALKDITPSIIEVKSVSFDGRILSLDRIPEGESLGYEIDDFKRKVFFAQENINVNGKASLIAITYESGRTETFVIVEKEITGAGKVYEVLPSGARIKEIITFGESVGENVYAFNEADKVIYTLDAGDILIGVKAGTFVIPSNINQIEIKEIECGDDICSKGEDCKKDCEKKSLLWLWVACILIVCLAVFYIFFYRGKYSFEEIWKGFFGSPFRTHKDFENVRNYINNSLKKGFGKEEIVEILLEKGWTKRQIKYTFNNI